MTMDPTRWQIRNNLMHSSSLCLLTVTWVGVALPAHCCLGTGEKARAGGGVTPGLWLYAPHDGHDHRTWQQYGNSQMALLPSCEKTLCCCNSLLSTSAVTHKAAHLTPPHSLNTFSWDCGWMSNYDPNHCGLISIKTTKQHNHVIPTPSSALLQKWSHRKKHVGLQSGPWTSSLFWVPGGLAGKRTPRHHEKTKHQSITGCLTCTSLFPFCSFSLHSLFSPHHFTSPSPPPYTPPSVSLSLSSFPSLGP